MVILDHLDEFQQRGPAVASFVLQRGAVLEGGVGRKGALPDRVEHALHSLRPFFARVNDGPVRAPGVGVGVGVVGEETGTSTSTSTSNNNTNTNTSINTSTSTNIISSTSTRTSTGTSTNTY